MTLSWQFVNSEVPDQVPLTVWVNHVGNKVWSASQLGALAANELGHGARTNLYC